MHVYTLDIFQIEVDGFFIIIYKKKLLHTYKN